MSTILTIVVGLLVLTVLVLVHEMGHYFVGRACDIRIEEFAVGFGPKLLSKVKNGIRYSIRALPLGGFVQFYGEDQNVENEPRAFNNRSVWRRFLTLLAGPFMNIVFAVIITIFVLTLFGDYVPVIAKVETNMPAAQAGLMVGDRIVGVNGKSVDFSMEFSLGFLQAEEAGDSISLSVERNGQIKNLNVPFIESADGSGRIIGITYVNERTKFGFFEACALSFKWLFLIIVQMVQFLGGLIFRWQGAGDVAGPVGTISIIGAAVRSGPEVMMRLAGLLSVNFAIINLLPFPGLDGGRIALLGVEAVRRKPIPREKEGYINLVGLIILFGLMILLTIQDIGRLISG